jgi:glycosyltransferase involved in cell wall biosynthesis
MSVPKLSVILPNYNHAEFLPQCVEAILSQSFTDLELIVVDDASTDNSRELLAAYARHDSRVRLYQNPKNSGVIASLNRALELTRADYVFGAASDDYVLPGYFQAAMDLFAAHPMAGVSFGLAECVDEYDRVKFHSPGMWSDEPRFLTPQEAAPRMTTCGVPGPVIWRKAAFLEAGGYHSDLNWHGDWFPLQVIAFRYGVCFIPERTSVVREVADSYSNNQRKRKVQRELMQRLLGRMVSPAYRDVLWGFTASGILRQFEAEIVRAAATMPNLPDELLPPLHEPLFGHAANTMLEHDPDVRAGVASLLGRHGRAAFRFYDLLEHYQRMDSSPAVRIAAKNARAEIRRDMPTVPFIKSRVRRTAARFLLWADRCTRPLHHQRLERIERHLAHMVHLQNQQLSHYDMLFRLRLKEEQAAKKAGRQRIALRAAA